MMNGPGAMQQAIAEKQAQVSGDWFFWIAGVSLVSSVLSLTGTSFYTALGLGTTEFVDGVAQGLTAHHSAASGKIVALVFAVLASACYALYGFFARKGVQWAFLVGMIFYALDAVLLLTFQSWLSVAFHGYALFRIFQGFQAARQLSVLRKQSAGFAATGYVPPSSSPSNDIWPPPPSA